MDSLALRSEIPYLRRYARAITGSQRTGDSAVRMVLETLLEDPAALPEQQSVRRGLYRLLHKVWPTETLSDDEADNPTAMLDQKSRQALFLSAVEGFSTGDIAVILDVSEALADQHLNTARDIIEGELRSEILVIEDEAIVAMHIRSIIEKAGHRCVGTARTHREAVEQNAAKRPELILADISLADGSSGIDAVTQILEEYDVPVIFVTAYPERLLTGERPEPTYLITKPFEPTALLATISQALLFHREGNALHERPVETASQPALH
jgi:CheY-like chemotaxis protein/DNA-directed RNA polymerase specialized sigma24 family protein